LRERERERAEQRGGDGGGRIVQEARLHPLQVGGAAGHPQAGGATSRRQRQHDGRAGAGAPSGDPEAGAPSRRPRQRAGLITRVVPTQLNGVLGAALAAGDAPAAAVVAAPAVHVRALRHVAGAALHAAAAAGTRGQGRRRLLPPLHREDDIA
jgi:hypothetical protein